MNKVTCGISVSLDGYVAGPNQTFERPFGDLPDTLRPLGDVLDDVFHDWMFKEPEKHIKERAYQTDGGAFIMGANMFGPKDRRLLDDWKGWWGDNPPFHAPVFVLSHQARVPIAMKGGNFVYFCIRRN